MFSQFCFFNENVDFLRKKIDFYWTLQLKFCHDEINFFIVALLYILLFGATLVRKCIEFFKSIH